MLNSLVESVVYHRKLDACTIEGKKTGMKEGVGSGMKRRLWNDKARENGSEGAITERDEGN